MWGAQTIFNVSGGYYLIFDDACRGAYYAPVCTPFDVGIDFFVFGRLITAPTWLFLFSCGTCRGVRIPAVFSVCARYSRIRNVAGPLFSCKRGPLEKYPTGIFFNSPPKMRPAAMRVSPIAIGDAKGRCPFGFPTTFYKRWTKILSCGVATATLLVMSTQTVNGLLGQYKAGILSANDRLDG